VRLGKRIAVIAALAGGFMAFGCLTPKYVMSITSRGGEMKFLYATSAKQQGIIECKTAPDGELSDCHDKPIVFQE
jgi:hypothetical protein